MPRRRSGREAQAGGWEMMSEYSIFYEEDDDGTWWAHLECVCLASAVTRSGLELVSAEFPDLRSAMEAINSALMLDVDKRKLEGK